MTEAARAVLDHAFNELGFADVVAATDPPNTASIRVLERLGMTPRGEVLHDGKPSLYFSLTRERFEQLVKQPNAAALEP